MLFKDQVVLAVELVKVLDVVGLSLHLDAVGHHLLAVKLFHHLKSLLLLLFTDFLKILLLDLRQIDFLKLFYSFLG